MNIIETVQAALLSYPQIVNLHIDYNENAPGEYGLYPTGDRLIKEDVLGNQERQHTFILYADFQSFNDYDRLANSGTLLSLQQWLERFPDNQPVTAAVGESELSGNLKKITCANGMLFSIPDGNLNAAVRYQLQITADYTIESEEFTNA